MKAKRVSQRSQSSLESLLVNETSEVKKLKILGKQFLFSH